MGNRMVYERRMGLNNAMAKMWCGCAHTQVVKRCPWHEVAHEGQTRLMNEHIRFRNWTRDVHLRG